MDIFDKYLLQQPVPQGSARFNAYEGSAEGEPQTMETYDKTIFLSKECEEQWNNLPEDVKRRAVHHTAHWIANQMRKSQKEYNDRLLGSSPCSISEE